MIFKRQICPFTLVPLSCFSFKGLQAMGGSTGGWKGWTAISCFPRLCFLHPLSICLLPLPQHSPLHPSHCHTQSSKQRLKVMHGHRTWHLLCTGVVGWALGGRGNNRDGMRGQRWIKYFITWKRLLLPQRLRSKQTRKKLLFLQLSSVRTGSLPPPILTLPCFSSS